MSQVGRRDLLGLRALKSYDETTRGDVNLMLSIERWVCIYVPAVGYVRTDLFSGHIWGSRTNLRTEHIQTDASRPVGGTRVGDGESGDLGQFGGIRPSD